MSAFVACLRKPRGRGFWIAAALVAANEVRGLIVVYLVLRGWGYL